MHNRKWIIVLLFVCMCMLITGCGDKKVSEKEVQEIYAETLKNYYEVKPLIYGALIALGEEITDDKGQNYLVVEEPAYQDLESVRNALESAFSDAYIEAHLSWVLEGEHSYYKEIDGRLCVAEADAVGESPTEEILSIMESGEDTIKITAAGSDNESYEITLVQEENKWVIDQMDWLSEE